MASHEKPELILRATIECMITFKELRIGTGAAYACTLCGKRNGVPAGPMPLSEIDVHIDAIAPASVMMRGFEPFKHPNLVGIISQLTQSGVRQIGMRTNGGALSSPRDAQGCIEAGVRVFEVPILAGAAKKSDRMSGIQGLHEAALQGVRQINASASDLNANTFVCAIVPICSHNTNQLIGITQAALSAGAQAIRIECDDLSYLDPEVLAVAHTIATRASVSFSGDGCDTFIDGARLYEVIA